MGTFRRLFIVSFSFLQLLLERLDPLIKIIVDVCENVAELLFTELDRRFLVILIDILLKFKWPLIFLFHSNTKYIILRVIFIAKIDYAFTSEFSFITSAVFGDSSRLSRNMSSSLKSPVLVMHSLILK